MCGAKKLRKRCRRGNKQHLRIRDRKAGGCRGPIRTRKGGTTYRDGVTAPRLIYSVEPDFTEEAREAKLRGDCVVSATVDDKGLAERSCFRSLADSVAPAKRDAALSLDAKAIEAVKGYRWKPALFGNRPMPIDMHITANFQIL